MAEKIRILKDNIAGKFMALVLVSTASVVVVLGLALYWKSIPLLENHAVHSLLSSSEWKPMKGKFGFFPFIMGTLWVTGLAILFSLPVSLLTAIYISEYAGQRSRKLIAPVLDLLSGIPPVVYGVWGVLFVVPLIQEYIAPAFSKYSSGYGVLAGGIVLSIMISPLIISMLLGVFATVPKEMKDASLSLGATRWQTTKHVLLRKSGGGILVTVVLAISRSFGETVLMVCGNVPLVPHSIFYPAYPLPTLIANNYGEMLSVPKYDSALLFAALILFGIILLFNLGARILLNHIEKKAQ
jgi:phosphate transport system permease protein